MRHKSLSSGQEQLEPFPPSLLPPPNFNKPPRHPQLLSVPCQGPAPHCTLQAHHSGPADAQMMQRTQAGRTCTDSCYHFLFAFLGQGRTLQRDLEGIPAKCPCCPGSLNTAACWHPPPRKPVQPHPTEHRGPWKTKLPHHSQRGLAARFPVPGHTQPTRCLQERSGHLSTSSCTSPGDTRTSAHTVPTAWRFLPSTHSTHGSEQSSTFSARPLLNSFASDLVHFPQRLSPKTSGFSV